jgi:hypothetical protein
VNPDSSDVQVFRFAQSAEKPAGLYRGRQSFQSPLLPGLKIPVTKIFQ